MLCFHCGELRRGRNGFCDICGHPLVRNTPEAVRTAIDARVLVRVRELTGRWVADGSLTRDIADRIEIALGSAISPVAPSAPPRTQEPFKAPTAKHSPNLVPVVTPPLVVDPADTPPNAPPTTPPNAPPTTPRPAQRRAFGPERTAPSDIADVTARVLGHGDGALVGADVFAALDAPELVEPSRWESEIRPLLYENIGWFIGTLLVLAGSIYGVREAWRSLDGLWRHLVVTAAFGLYHAGFAGLARLLSPRSASTGRVLGGISVALLPVVFISLSSLFAVSFSAGALALALVALGSLATLASASRRFEMPSATGFSRAILPALLAQLPLLSLSQTSIARWLIPFVGVASVGRTGLALAASRETPAALFASIYGALSLAILSLVGAPTAATDPSLAASAATLWAAALCALGAELCALPSLRERWTSVASVTDVSALGLLSALCAAGALRAFAAPGDLVVGGSAIIHSALVALTFTRALKRHPAALHVALPALSLGSALVAHALSPSPAWWTFAAALSPAMLAVPLARSPNGRVRTVSLRWTASLCSLGVVATALLDPTAPAALCAGLALCVCAHASGALGAQWMHYPGALGALVAALGCLGPRDGAPLGALSAALAFLSLLYAIAGLARPSDRALSPLDDLSLGSGVLGALFGLVPLLGPAPRAAFAVLVAPWRAVWLVALLGLGLIARASRDRSRGVSLIGACALGCSLFAYASPVSAAQQAFVASAIALCASGLAATRPIHTAEPSAVARTLLGSIALPWPARWRTSVADGFAGLAALSALLCVVSVVGWMTSMVEPDRPLVVLACAALSLAGAVGFVTRAFGVVALRGSVVALALAGALAALGGVANRIGRPLPQRVVGLRLSVMILALWCLARLLVAYGPRICARLENPSHGNKLHFVPHAGVFALGALLGLDALIVVSSDTTRALATAPPTLCFGAALAWVLLGRSACSRRWMHPAALCSLMGASLVASTRSLTGPLTAPPLEISSVLWLRAALGLSVGALALGALTAGIVHMAPLRVAIMSALLPGAEHNAEAGPVRDILSHWVVAAAGALLLGGFWSASLTASIALIAAGALLVISRARRAGIATSAAGALSVVHAWSCGHSAVPMWSGAALAVLSLTVVLSGPVIARRYGLHHARVFGHTHALSAVFGSFALVYALAEGALPRIPWGVAVLIGSVYGLVGQWLSSWALTLTATVLTGVLGVAAAQSSSAQGDKRTRALAMECVLGAAMAADTAVLVVLASGERTNLTLTAVVLGAGTLVALSNATVAMLAHIASRRVASRAAAAQGLRRGRDLVLCASGAWALVFVLVTQGAGVAAPGYSLGCGLFALGLAVAISLDAAWRESSGGHVYFVQSAIVGAYALIRVLLARGLSPEFDAVCALGLGFALVGVTVQAHRAGIGAVAVATRRFAALVPVAVAFVLPELVSPSGALAAAGVSVLYGLLGYIERSRVFGSLGAAAANIALLLGALASGLSGVEVYAGPLGLFVLCLGQLFGASLTRGARVTLRVVGSLLLYLPAAAQLAFQVGNAQSGMYPVLFGLVCLAGVGAGMLLHIRAYLALGTLFLVLDVVESLVHAGLRDHRVGFVILSASGLAILGVMVLTTLKRDAFRELMARVRARIGAWD